MGCQLPETLLEDIYQLQREPDSRRHSHSHLEFTDINDSLVDAALKSRNDPNHSSSCDGNHFKSQMGPIHSMAESGAKWVRAITSNVDNDVIVIIDSSEGTTFSVIDPSIHSFVTYSSVNYCASSCVRDLTEDLRIG